MDHLHPKRKSGFSTWGRDKKSSQVVRRENSLAAATRAANPAVKEVTTFVVFNSNDEATEHASPNIGEARLLLKNYKINDPKSYLVERVTEEKL